MREEPLLSEELRARADLTLAAVLRAVLVVLPVLLAANFAAYGGAPSTWLLGAALPYIAVVALLQRQGHFEFSIHAVVYGLIVLGAAISAMNGTVRSLGTIGLIAAILIGGVFLRRRSLAVAVAISVASIAGLIHAENAGWLPEPKRSVTLAHWIMYSAVIVAVALVLSHIRSMLLALVARLSDELEQRRVAEAAGKASEARFRQVFDLSPVGMTVTRVSDARYVEVNSADKHTLGYSREELLGRTTLEMGAWLSAADRQRFLETLRSRGGVEGYETRMRHRSGEMVECRTWARFAEIDGEQCVLASTINVTDQLRAERKLQEDLRELNAVLEQRVHERTEQLETANRDLEGFSYSVSHDLRAPLRAISGFSALLREKEAERLSERGRGLLLRVEEGARRAAALIDALLEFSRLGRKPVTKVVAPMSGIVHEVLRELSAVPEARRADVRVAALPDCQGDPILLKQVWQNLIGNALKYSRKREQPVVEIGHDDGEYFVRDNGAGFDMQYAPKLFGVFERLHSAAEFEGTGIGLATAKRIVQRHNGAIRAEGAPDRGATFRFSVPDAR